MAKLTPEEAEKLGLPTPGFDPYSALETEPEPNQSVGEGAEIDVPEPSTWQKIKNYAESVEQGYTDEFKERPAINAMTRGVPAALGAWNAALKPAGKAFQDFTGKKNYAEAFTEALAGIAGVSEDAPMPGGVTLAGTPAEDVVRARFPEAVPLVGGAPVAGSIAEFGAQAAIPIGSVGKGAKFAHKLLAPTMASKGLVGKAGLAIGRSVGAGASAMPGAAAMGAVSGGLNQESTAGTGAVIGAGAGFIGGAVLHAGFGEAPVLAKDIKLVVNKIKKYRAQNVEGKVVRPKTPAPSASESRLAMTMDPSHGPGLAREAMAMPATKAKEALPWGMERPPVFEPNELIGPPGTYNRPKGDPGYKSKKPAPTNSVPTMIVLSRDADGYQIARMVFRHSDDTIQDYTVDTPLTPDNASKLGRQIARDDIYYTIDPTHYDDIKSSYEVRQLAASVYNQLRRGNFSGEPGTQDAMAPVFKDATVGGRTTIDPAMHSRETATFVPRGRSSRTGQIEAPADAPDIDFNPHSESVTEKLAVVTDQTNSIRIKPLRKPDPEVTREVTRRMSIADLGKIGPTDLGGAGAAYNPKSELPAPKGLIKSQEEAWKPRPLSQDEMLQQIKAAIAAKDTALADKLIEEITPKPPPSQEVVKKLGAQVYLGTPGGGGGGLWARQGHVVGPDPKKAGNTLVKMANGQTRSHPTNHIFPTTPPGIAQHADLLNGLPVQVPVMPAMQQIPANMQRDIRNVFSLVKAFKLDREPTLAKKVLGGALADHLYGPDKITEMIAKAQASEGIYQGSLHELLSMYDKALPKRNFFSAAAIDLAHVHAGKMSLADLKQKHPEVGDFLLKKTQALMDERTRLDREIVELGGVNPDYRKMRDSGEMEEYQAALYRAHWAGKGNFAKVAPDDALTVGVDHLINEHVAAKSGWNQSQIAHEVLNIMNSDEPMLSYLSSPISKPAQHLLKKGIIHPAIKGLLGEETSGAIRGPVSIATQRSIANRLRVWDEIWKARETDALGRQVNPLWSPGPIGSDWVQVPDNKRLFGRAANGFVHPDLEALTRATQANLSAGLAAARGFGALVKSSQILLGSPLAYPNQLIRTIRGLVASEAIDLSRPMESGAALFTGLVDLLKWNGIPLVMKGNPIDPLGDSIIMEARNAGALPQGFGRSNFKSDWQGKLLKQLAKNLGTFKGQSFFDILGGIRNVASHYWKGVNAAGAFYDFLEQLGKMVAVKSLRPRFLREAYGLGLQGQDAVEYASRKYAANINDAFANFEHSGRVVNDMRNSTFGSVAPYFQGQAEDLRAMGTTGAKLFSARGSSLRWKMATAALIMADMYLVIRMLREARGISEDHVDAMMKVRTQREQFYTPNEALVVLPFFGSDGKPIVYNMSQPFPELQLLYGHPDDAALNKIASNLMMTPIQGAPGEASVRKYLFENPGIVRPPPNMTPRRIEGKQGWEETIKGFFGRGLPGAFKSVPDTLKSGGAIEQQNPNRESLSQEGMAARLGGLNVRQSPTVPGTFGATESPSMRAGTLEFSSDVSDLKGQIFSIFTNTDLTPDQREEYLAAIVARLKQRASQIEERNQAVKKAQPPRRKLSPEEAANLGLPQ